MIEKPEGVEEVFIVGDIHGCFDELVRILEQVGYFERSDLMVILVGDLVSKGPKSLEVIQFSREHELLAVRGNHDDSLLNSVRKWKERGEGGKTEEEKGVECIGV